MANPLYKKLGIKPETTVWTIHAPSHFADLLLPLPNGVHIQEHNPARLPEGDFGLAVLFAQSETEMRHTFNLLWDHLGAQSSLWMAWPKKASKVPSDLSFQCVQQLGLAVGLVDNKVCSIDDTWTALRMVVRLENRPSWKQ